MTPSIATGPDAPLMLTVSGRGLVGLTMTPAVAAEFAAAFGSFVKERTGQFTPTLCVGRDSRPSGGMLAPAVISGLVSVGCRVIDLGVVMTPTVGVMIHRHHADAGMVVTASHNPIIWNGLKCLNHQGVAPPPDDAQQVIDRFRDGRIDYVPAAGQQSVERDDTAHDTHIAAVLDNIEPAPIRNAAFTVVLDSVNGAGCTPGRMLLEQLGCNVIHINGEPTGYFAHTPEPIAENLTGLCEKVRVSKEAACGFAQDPDADRLAVVDETGRYIGEEYTLVLAAKRVLDLHAARGGGPCALAANLSTSRMIDDLAAQYEGVTVRRSAVGEANVAAALQSADQPALVGGEGNGGVIFPPVTWVRDSLTAMALVLDLLAAERKPLSEIVDALPRYEMIKQKIDLTDVGGRDAVDRILADVTRAFSSQNLNTADGVRIDFAYGWVHIRPSNTEPILRIIAEAKTTNRAQGLIDEVSRAAALV